MAAGIFQEWVLRFGVDNKQALGSLGRMEKSFNRLKKIITTVIAGKMVKDMANFGKEIGLMADRTGMSISKLSSLRGAFISAGSSAGAFNKAINSISDGLLGLSMGRGDFAAKLGMFGISPFTAGGTLKTPEEVYYDIADWAKSQKGIMSDRDIMYRLMSQFGFDEATAKSMLGGRAGIQASEERAKAEYRVIDDETANKLSAISISLSELWQTFEVGLQKIVATFSPIIEGIINGFKGVGEAIEVLTSSFGENKEEIKAFGEVFDLVIGGAVKAIAGLVYWLKEAVIWFKNFMFSLEEKLSGWLGKLIGFGGKDEEKAAQQLQSNPNMVSIAGEQIDQIRSGAAVPIGSNSTYNEVKNEIIINGNVDSETYDKMQSEYKDANIIMYNAKQAQS